MKALDSLKALLLLASLASPACATPDGLLDALVGGKLEISDVLATPILMQNGPVTPAQNNVCVDLDGLGNVAFAFDVIGDAGANFSPDEESDEKFGNRVEGGNAFHVLIGRGASFAHLRNHCIDGDAPCEPDLLSVSIPFDQTYLSGGLGPVGFIEGGDDWQPDAVHELVTVILDRNHGNSIVEVNGRSGMRWELATEEDPCTTVSGQAGEMIGRPTDVIGGDE